MVVSFNEIHESKVTPESKWFVNSEVIKAAIGEIVFWNTAMGFAFILYSGVLGEEALSEILQFIKTVNQQVQK